MLFKYKIKNKEGNITEGTTEAVDRFAVARDFREKGITPILIEEQKKNSFNISLDGIFGGVKMQDLILFTKNLSGMLKAGLSAGRALSVLEKQTPKAFFKKIITDLIDEINNGGTLSGGLAKKPKAFSPLFVSMVRAGEESGNLAGALTEIAMNLEKANSLTKKVKGAMMYPGVIISAMVIIGILMFAFVVPTLANTFKELGVTLPPTTRFVLWLGDAISNNLVLTLLGVVFLGIGLYFLFTAKASQKYIDFVVLKLPVFGTMARELNTARTARTLSSLILSGVSITRAIEITRDVVQNVYYKKVMEDAVKSVEKGLPFAKIFDENPKLYPVMMTEMVQVGEETGKLADMLQEIAIFYENEIENKTKNLSTIIEPILMILIGAGVGFFALSMITPLYSVLNNIG